MKLTHEWQPYNGDYQKKMQDIMLENGEIITDCWPNAGYWNCCKKQGNEKHYAREIKHTEAAFVRLTKEQNL